MDETILSVCDDLAAIWCDDPTALQPAVDQMVHNYELLKGKIVPDSYPEETAHKAFEYLLMKNGLNRESFIAIGALPLIAKDWIVRLADWIGNRRCLEVMCGSGMLTKALRDQSISVIATDDFSWSNGNSKWFSENSWISDAKRLDCIDALKEYAKQIDLVIMSWPWMDNTAYQLLKAMRNIKPSLQLVYLGEFGECCADSSFTSAAIIVENAEFDDINSYLRSWSRIHDRIMLIQ